MSFVGGYKWNLLVREALTLTLTLALTLTLLNIRERELRAKPLFFFLKEGTEIWAKKWPTPLNFANAYLLFFLFLLIWLPKS